MLTEILSGIILVFLAIVAVLFIAALVMFAASIGITETSFPAKVIGYTTWFFTGVIGSILGVLMCILTLNFMSIVPVIRLMFKMEGVR